MADITKRTNKRVAEHLDGETIEVALLCEMKGALGAGAVGSVLATRTTQRAMRRRTGDALDAEGGKAAEFPAEACAVGVTATKLYAFPSNGLTFKAPALVVDRTNVTAELLGRKGLGKRLALTFVDGSQVEVDIGAMQPLDRFVELLRQP